MRRIIVLLCVGLLPATAAAEGTAWDLWTGVSFRHVPSLDLAEIAGVKDRGSGNDASLGSLAAEVGAGVEIIPETLVGLNLTLGTGGLALDSVEDRYGTAGSHIGSSISAEAALRAVWMPALTDRVDLMLGGATGLHLLSAVSGTVAARVASLTVGPLLGARFKVNRIGRGDGAGYVQAVVDYRYHAPTLVGFPESAAEAAAEGEEGENEFREWESTQGDGFSSFGASLSYLIVFR